MLVGQVARAYGVDHEVNAPAVGELSDDPSHIVLITVVDPEKGSQLIGALKLLVRAGGHNDLGVEEPCQLERCEGRSASDAVNENRITHPQIAARHEHPPRGHMIQADEQPPARRRGELGFGWRFAAGTTIFSA